MAVSDVSQKYDVIIRIFEILKYQNIPALTVWPIVPITFLVLNNHQSGRLAAKNSNSAEIAFFTFWSNVTKFQKYASFLIIDLESFFLQLALLVHQQCFVFSRNRSALNRKPFRGQENCIISCAKSALRSFPSK